LIASWRDTQSAAIQAFGEALSQLMASASLRIQLGAAARRRVEAIEPAAVLGQWKDLIAAVVQEYDHRLT
jgi:glycosyltransferase involved in cell wall biosynthesis